MRLIGSDFIGIGETVFVPKCRLRGARWPRELALHADNGSHSTDRENLTCVEYHSAHTITCLIVIIHADSLHPRIVSVTWIVYVAAVYL